MQQDDPRIDRDPREPVNDEPPVDVPPDNPAADEPERRDPDPREPAWRDPQPKQPARQVNGRTKTGARRLRTPPGIRSSSF